MRLELDTLEIDLLLQERSLFEMERLGAEGEAIAKRLAPVSYLPQDIPGLLRDSITHRIEWYEDLPGAVIGSPVRYALYPEYGVIHHTPSPYLRPMLMALTV
jgi:hypothetical protein